MSTAAVPRPRSAVEIIDASVRLVRQHYGPMVALTALFSVPYSVAQRLLFPALTTASISAVQTGRLAEALPPLRLYAWSLGSLFWYTCTTAVVLTLAAAHAHAGQDIHLGDEVRGMVQRLPSTLGLVALAIPLAILLCVLAALIAAVPALTIAAVGVMVLPRGIGGSVAIVMAILLYVALLIYMAAALLTSLPILVLERVGPRASLRRSAQLTHGLRKHAMAVYSLTYLVVAVLLWGLALTVRLAGQPILTVIVVTAAGIALAPFSHVPVTLLYYDLRVRKEGYDIEVMAGALEGTATPQIA